MRRKLAKREEKYAIKAKRHALIVAIYKPIITNNKKKNLQSNATLPNDTLRKALSC